MGRRRRDELLVYAFDLLHRDGKDLRPFPLIERRRRLERLLASPTARSSSRRAIGSASRAS
jgi:ATP-dependent DNA ligase